MQMNKYMQQMSIISTFQETYTVKVDLNIIQHVIFKRIFEMASIESMIKINSLQNSILAGMLPKKIYLEVV